MNARRALVVATAVLLTAPMARSGHELPVYPSYYPHEIEIAALAPERAAELMRSGKLHAYVGGTPAFAAAPDDKIGIGRVARRLRRRPAQPGFAARQG